MYRKMNIFIFPIFWNFLEFFRNFHYILIFIRNLHLIAKLLDSFSSKIQKVLLKRVTFIHIKHIKVYIISNYKMSQFVFEKHAFLPVICSLLHHIFLRLLSK